MEVGARHLTDGATRFTVWAPLARSVEVSVVAPVERLIPMEMGTYGYWAVTVENTPPGSRYFYRLDGGRERPDPASHFQPEGVHGPSEVVDHEAFGWADSNWCGVPLNSMIIYELHAGTFTPEGTLDAIVPRVGELCDLGITALEVMPLSQFPGGRNWGYDGAYPYAVQNSYGGPEAFRRLVDACHAAGIAVIYDAVYNHFGPEGCYVRDFGPYFTHKYISPWGDAVNLDDAGSDHVRNYFFENARHWFEHYHVDALRLDAIQGIYDLSATPFLRELAEKTEKWSQKLGRPLLLIAESDLNDSRVIRRRENGGHGLHAQWADDFHHCLHTLITGQGRGYYADFKGVDQLVTAIREGYVYSWKYSEFRKRHHGNYAGDLPASRFVFCSQNHDQVGNQVMGERLTALAPFEALKLAAAAVLLAPAVPLLFMGEEYGEHTPFLYFISHNDAELVEAVRQGRKQEFAHFRWDVDPPDPAAPETFARSKLNWHLRTVGRHAALLAFYRELIRLRRETPALAALDRSALDAESANGAPLVFVRRWHGGGQVWLAMNFSSSAQTFASELPRGSWHKLLDSSEERWSGPGPAMPETVAAGDEVSIAAWSVALYGLTA